VSWNLNARLVLFSQFNSSTIQQSQFDNPNSTIRPFEGNSRFRKLHRGLRRGGQVFIVQPLRGLLIWMFGVDSQFDKSTIQQFTSSIIKQLDNPTVHQFTSSPVRQFNNPTNQQINNPTISILGSTILILLSPY